MNRLLLALSFVIAVAPSSPARAAEEYSVAEQRVFIDNHMKNITKATTLDYGYVQTGKPEDSFEDRVKLAVGSGTADKRTLAVDYLSGKHHVELPSVEGGTGNPVILYFLEDDIRAMHDRLGGQQAYFRKRIRLALADAAKVRPVKLSYRGKQIDGSEVTIEPYVNDALKDRFGQFAGKVYVFTMAEAIPGGVYELRTRVEAGSDAAQAPAVTTSLKIADSQP